MADEVEVQDPVDEEEDFSKWLAALGDDDEDEVEEEVMAETAQDDQKALKIANKTKNVVRDYITADKTEKMMEKFEATASEEARELFTIYSSGVDVEDPRQLKRIMDLAKTKAEAVKKGTEEEVATKAEQLARQLAKDDYGVGPISGAGSSTTPEEDWDRIAKLARAGNSHASFALFNALEANGESSVSG